VLRFSQDVFESVLVRPVTVEGGEHRGLVHLWWSAPQQGDRLVQVYLDGELIEVSQDPSQRELWVMCDRERGHRIELLAVDANAPELLLEAHPEELRGWDSTIYNDVSFGLIRDERLVVDAEVVIKLDGEDVDRGLMWPVDESRGGFGAVFGEGGFGFDAAASLGLGRGELGMGLLGSDGTAWRWRRYDLGAGTHSLSVQVMDRKGQLQASPLDITGVVVESLPVPAETFTVDPDFTLRWAV